MKAPSVVAENLKPPSLITSEGRMSPRMLSMEALGTFILVFVGVGSAVSGLIVSGVVAVAFAFGLVVLALVYMIGPISGCHVNPAITVGMLFARKVSLPGAAGYWIAQCAGAIAAAALLKWFTTGLGVTDQTGNLGANNWGLHISMGGAFILEVVLTFILVLVVLMVTDAAAAPGFAGLAIGFTLAALHMVAIPLDGTSVNPARSLGPAIFAGGTALSHVWLFIVAPLLGGIVAGSLWPAIHALQAPGPEASSVRRSEAGERPVES